MYREVLARYPNPDLVTPGRQQNPFPGIRLDITASDLPTTLGEPFGCDYFDLASLTIHKL